LSPSRLKKRHDTGLGWEIGSGSLFPLWVDTVEKVVSDPPKRNNRIRTARYLNRNCVRGRDFESMLRIQGRKIVFQQYRSKADISHCNRDVRFTPESGHVQRTRPCLLWANSGLMQCSNR